MSDVKPPIRRIRSFVLREGRLTQGQQRAFEQIWPYFGVPFEGTPLDLPKLFGNCNPVYLEIGFGDGESLAQMAAVNPEYNYLGVEVHRPGVGHLLLKIEQQSLTNLYVIRHDAVEILSQGLTDASLAGIYLFFPTPGTSDAITNGASYNRPLWERLPEYCDQVVSFTLPPTGRSTPAK